MTNLLEKKAIKASLTTDWQEAIKLNKKILSGDKKNRNALNRLAYAYYKTGDYQKAEDLYSKVIKIDPYCSIAERNLKKIHSVKKTKTAPPQSSSHSNSPLNDLFLNEPGKTKIIALINLAPFEILSSLTPSQPLAFTVKKRNIVLSTKEDEYIGAIPDDLSFHLINLINGGNKYKANIYSVKKNNLTVVFREIYRSPKFKNQASFI